MKTSVIGKFLDQPLIISKLKDKTPKLLAGAAFAYGAYDTLKTKKEDRKNRAIKNTIILSTVTATSLISAFGLKIGKKQLFSGLVNVKNQKEILAGQKNVIDNFLKENHVDKKTQEALSKAKTGILGLKDTKEVLKLANSNVKNSQNAQYNGIDELFDTLFSKKENLNAKEIFKETGRLSFLGLMPVASGVISGILAEKITDENTPKSSSDKIKEGAYQFLANIFMCNVGAAGALFAAERLQKAGKIKALTPIKKLGVIMGGIFITGIMGGSFVANWIGKKVLDPIFDKKYKHPKTQLQQGFALYSPLAFKGDEFNKITGGKALKVTQDKPFKPNQPAVPTKTHISGGNEPIMHANSPDIENSSRVKPAHCGQITDTHPLKTKHSALYAERKPELLDMALHTDDIATAGILSGFKWIEPMLPLMYTISGYRAGIGYRNNAK